MISLRRLAAPPAVRSRYTPVIVVAAVIGIAAAATLHVVRPQATLLLSTSQWATDQSAPTMDAMFPPGGFAMQHPILVWWVALELLGLLAFPFAALWLPNLADRGFVLSKTLGLLLLGWGVWIAVSLGVAQYDRPVIYGVLAILVITSLATSYRTRHDLLRVIRENRRAILSAEAVFLAGFVLFVLLRLWYPDLGHQFSPVSPANTGDGRMGEKQMELAFLNGIVRSRVFPPYDPFFAHGYINYYYFGYVLVGTLCKLTQIAPVVGFNLAIATFFALLVGTVFSVGTTLTNRLFPGVIAAVFVGLLSNLAGGWQFVTALIGVSTIHSAFPFFGGLVDAFSGLWLVVTHQAQLPAYDFWAPTRIIPPVGLDFAEFPYFTYLFADLHPHLMAYPMTVAALAVAVNLVLGRERHLVFSLLLGGLLLGAILATNPWDLPTYLLVIAMGAAVGVYASTRRLSPTLLLRPLAWLVGAGAAALVLYFPFEAQYQTVFQTGIGITNDISTSALQGMCNNNPTPCSQVIHDILATPLNVYLQQFGLFLFIVASFLVVLLATSAGGSAAARRAFTRVQFTLYYRDRLHRIRRAAGVAKRLHPVPHTPVVDWPLALADAIVVVGLAVTGYYLLAFLALTIGLVILLLLRLGTELPRRQLFVLTLLLVPLGISLLTQPFYIRDFLDGGAAFRMNTIFKFYNQVWVLLAVGAASALYYLVERKTPVPQAAQAPVAEPVLVGPAGPPRSDLSEPADPPALPPAPPQNFPERHGWWTAALAILLVGSLVYTYAGSIARETYRQAWLPQNSVPLTLNGMAFMKVAYPGDYAAIDWLNAHVSGVPVMAEAGGAYYNWRSRVAMFTGLTDMVNGFHEQTEQRPSAQIGSRYADLQTLYDSAQPAAAWRVIRQYAVRYIYVGFSERQEYSAAGIAKFQHMVGHGLRVAFRYGSTVIYEVKA